MLKKLKQGFLSASRQLGVFSLSSRSRWRQNSLLILAYHGVSLDDEHLWDPRLYMSPEQFRLRMQTIKDLGCSVLPLGDAIQRLYANDLPPRSVAITVDDGFYDFQARAYPILEEYGYPVTVYQTTYYCYYNRPVFGMMYSYLLWKGCQLSIEGLEFTGRPGSLDLSTEIKRMAACKEISAFVGRANFSAEDKDNLASLLAKRLNVDYGMLLSRRILHLLKPEDIEALANKGVDVQLHTHRHRTPRDHDAFVAEIQQNRTVIENLTRSPAIHFCYPNGNHIRPFSQWLAQCGVHSATTCTPGLATHRTDPFFLPRLVDTSPLSQVEFEGWLCGVSRLIPRRPAWR
jgi:peptidoglycan/xylan/chitin deacetylase (PgdA/CDA1 family)